MLTYLYGYECCLAAVSYTHLDVYKRQPYFFAGGLTPENAAGAVRRFHPYAVDVSSGIETDKKKDMAKIAEFAVNVRAAELLPNEDENL